MQKLNPNNRNTETALELLKQSAITPAAYTPSKSYLDSLSVAVTLDGKPLFFIGYADSKECNNQALALASNKDFRKIMNFIFGGVFVYGIGHFHNSCYFKLDKSYNAVAGCIQGVRDDSGMGSLEVVIATETSNDKGLAAAFALCVYDKIMRIIVPTAKPITAIEFEG